MRRKTVIFLAVIKTNTIKSNIYNYISSKNSTHYNRRHNKLNTQNQHLVNRYKTKKRVCTSPFMPYKEEKKSISSIVMSNPVCGEV